jgi:AraC-like DNA-binding protein
MHTQRLKRSPRAYWEGKGRRILMVPNTTIRKLISRDNLFNLMYVTDMGYYSRAASHHVQRMQGAPEHIIFYCMDGKGWVETKRGYFKVGPNQAFVLPSNEQHQYGADPEDPWSIYWIMFSGKLCEDLSGMSAFRHYFKPQALLQPEKYIDLYEAMFSALSEGYSINNLRFANMNLLLIAMLFAQQDMDRHRKIKDTAVKKVVDFMKANIGRKLTINQLARIAAYSPSHLYNLFRAHTGHSPLDYFIHLKMQCACKYLNNTDLRIKEIAPLVGYEDQYLFTRIFTKIMGTSPQKYRSAIRV